MQTEEDLTICDLCGVGLSIEDTETCEFCSATMCPKCAGNHCCDKEPPHAH